MKKLLLIILIPIFLTACPLVFVSVVDRNRGQVIREYPDWCCSHKKLWDSASEKLTAESGGSAFGYSEWIDWQSEQGKKLHGLVSDDVISDDYQGKFRITVGGQTISIHFNDIKSSGASFFGYIGKYTSYDKDRMIDIDTNSDKVEFDCWLREMRSSIYDFYYGCFDWNRSTFSLVKIDDKTFCFSIIVDGDKTIDNIVLKNDSNPHETASIEKKYSWLPRKFREVIGTDYWKYEYYGAKKLNFSYKSGKWDLVQGCFCYEGISLRSVDEENKRISFWLEDRDKSDFADYLEIHITKENWTDEPKRGAHKYNKTLMKGTLGFYKIVDGESQVVKFYDEDHSEFSRLVD